MKQKSDPKIKRLLRLAKAASKKAYAPYSKYRVGAALLTAKGDMFTGANVENASSGLTICAERAAVVGAVAAGQRKFTAIAIYSPDEKNMLYPCGSCLQVLAEFAEDMVIYSTSANEQIQRTALKELLPRAFKC